MQKAWNTLRRPRNLSPSYLQLIGLGLLFVQSDLPIGHTARGILVIFSFVLIFGGRNV